MQLAGSSPVPYMLEPRRTLPAVALFDLLSPMFDKANRVGYSRRVKSLAAGAEYLRRSTRARRWLQIIAVLIVIFFFARAALALAPQLLSYNWQLDPAYLAAAVVLLFLRAPLGAYGWWAILERLGHRLTAREALRIMSHSNIAGFVPGSMWYAVSRVYLVEKVGVPRTITAISVGIESVMVLLAAAVVTSLGLFTWPQPPAWVPVAAVVLLVALLGLVLRPNAIFAMVNWALARFNRRPVEVRLSSGDLLRLLWPFVANWLLYGLMSFALVAALYPQLSVAYLPAVTGLFTASWMGGYLAVFVPQGLVVRELLVAGFLTSLLGIPAPVAAAAAVLSRAWSLLGIGLWGAIGTRL
jgi:uncharacterized membrane protein YbhN (UPF0104 family)